MSELKHLDRNGSELAVGDTVRWGEREGTVLILEDWAALGEGVVARHGREGVYVSDLGWWGDAKSVHASELVKVTPKGVGNPVGYGGELMEGGY